MSDRILNRSSQTKTRRFLRNNSTIPERLLWEKLKNKQMCGVKFRRQHVIGNYIVDFYSPSIKLAIEIDGESHNSKDAIEYDKKREEELDSIDTTLLRFRNEEIHNEMKSVLSRIELKTKELMKHHPVPAEAGTAPPY